MLQFRAWTSATGMDGRRRGRRSPALRRALVAGPCVSLAEGQTSTLELSKEQLDLT